MLILPNELILCIADSLGSERDINTLSRTNRRLHSFLDNFLYLHNALENGGSALTWAAIHDRVDTARKALDGGTGSLRHAIELAVEHDRKAVLDLLLTTGGVDIRATCWSALMSAAQRGQDSMVQQLLDSGRIDARARGRQRFTPLFWAAMNGHGSTAKIILDSDRVDVNVQDMMGRTAISFAAENDNANVVKLLLDSDETDVNCPDNSGTPPLSWAASVGSDSVVKLLLESDKVDANPERDRYGRTPLSWAASKGHQSTVKLLLDSGRVVVDPEEVKSGTWLEWIA